ncbi:MAG: hypothetical protein MnENMB40S_00760 [Rhizobiaceae bacterium MnEN-MB40S]|nr:MAG: hypothetical protein MnENMB40S_00760 [Rhizobiaceae bacterium MnEN-MB40S]
MLTTESSNVSARSATDSGPWAAVAGVAVKAAPCTPAATIIDAAVTIRMGFKIMSNAIAGSLLVFAALSQIIEPTTPASNSR